MHLFFFFRTVSSPVTGHSMSVGALTVLVVSFLFSYLQLPSLIESAIGEELSGWGTVLLWGALLYIKL